MGKKTRNSLNDLSFYWFSWNTNWSSLYSYFDECNTNYKTDSKFHVSITGGKLYEFDCKRKWRGKSRRKSKQKKAYISLNVNTNRHTMKSIFIDCQHQKTGVCKKSDSKTNVLVHAGVRLFKKLWKVKKN